MGNPSKHPADFIFRDWPMPLDEEDDPPPGVLRWLIACDESGVHGSPCYGFGTLWMTWQRRGDLAKMIRELRRVHHYRDEIKWNHVKRNSLAFYEALVEAFFKSSWLGFHCLVVRKAVVRRNLHASWDEARQKHFGMLLQKKIIGCIRVHAARPQTVRVYLDPMHSSYEKASEVLEKITRTVVERSYAGVRIEGAFQRDSKNTPTIQLCDVLLGSVMSAWASDPPGGAKGELRAFIANHLGWEDLHADTHPPERKFNIWMFFDTQSGKRQSATREVALLYPLPGRPRS
jgi:hypothetical protein